jgi:hypothetical protein
MPKLFLAMLKIANLFAKRIARKLSIPDPPGFAMAGVRAYEELEDPDAAMISPLDIECHGGSA